MCIGIKNEELPEFIATLAISKGWFPAGLGHDKK
jgi:hypothetical protein